MQNHQQAGNGGAHPFARYITHVIYLEGPGTPHVDVALLKSWGIECIKVYGRRFITTNDSGTGTSSANSLPKGMYYDIAALQGALEAVLGRGRRCGDSGRRFTLDSVQTSETGLKAVRRDNVDRQ